MTLTRRKVAVQKGRFEDPDVSLVLYLSGSRVMKQTLTYLPCLYWLQKNVTETYVFSEDGDPVGAATFTIRNGALRIYALAVRSDRQGAGRGTEIWEFILSYAKQHRIKKMTLLAGAGTPAAKWWTAKGFRPVSRKGTDLEMERSV